MKRLRSMLLCFAAICLLAGALALAACGEKTPPDVPPGGTQPAGNELIFVAQTAGVTVNGETYPFYDFAADVEEVTLVGRGYSEDISFTDGQARVPMSELASGEYEATYSYIAEGVTYTRSVPVAVDTDASQTVVLPVSPVSLGGRTSGGEMGTASMAVTVSGRSDTMQITRGGGYAFLDGSGSDTRYYVEGVFDAAEDFGDTDIGGLLVAYDTGKPNSGIFAGICSNAVCFAIPSAAAANADAIYRVANLADYEGEQGYDASRVRIGVLRDGARYFVFINGTLAARWYCDSVAYANGEALPSAVGVGATARAGGALISAFNYTADEEALGALASLAGEETVDLYLIAGQSNAAGYSPMTDAVRDSDARNTDGYSNIFYAGDAVSNSGTTHHALDWRLVTQGLGRDSATFGAELGMANELSSYYNTDTGRKAAIVKFAVGGTSLLNNLENENRGLGNWVPPSYEKHLGSAVSDPQKTGNLYDLLIEETKERTAQLEALGYTVEIRALYWMQGERDIPDPDEYRIAFGYLVSDLRRDLSAELAVYVGEISKTFGGAETAENLAFVAAQGEIAAQTENCYLVECGDYKIGLQYGSPDTAHWSGEAHYAIGKLVGASILAHTLA